MNIKSLVFALIIILLQSLAFSGTWVDDFNDGDLDGWKMFEYFWLAKSVVRNSGNWVVENGHAIAGDDNSYRRFCLYIGDMSWKDYTAEVSVKLLSKRLEEGGVYTSVSIGARHQLDEGRFGYNEYVCCMWRFMGRVRRGGFIIFAGDVINDGFLEIPSEVDTWYRLRITVDGDHITCFIDDMKVYDIIDGAFASGAVTIAVNGVRAAFDDFIVSGPEIPDNNKLGRPVKLSGKIVTAWANIKVSN